MSENAQNALPYMTGVFLALALLLFLLSIRLFRRSRTDVFWRRRRDAGQRGWRTLVLSFMLIVLGGVSCVCTVLSAIVNEGESSPRPTEISAGPSPTPRPIETPTGLRTMPVPGSTENPLTTPSPDQILPFDTPTAVVVIITATPVYTPTETPFPTFTPLVTPLASYVTPGPDAAIQITALDDQISDSFTPVNPRAAFRAGASRIYLFVEFTGMAPGVLWKRELYRNGEQIDGNAYLWGLETEGVGYFFFGKDSGFAPGEYEIRLFIGDSDVPVSVTPFTIVEVP
jgi:hypothetical protein